MNKPSQKTKKADQYNDPNHNYLKYWDGRDYENASERIAINRFLKGKHFKHAADIGGGYGRLCVFLEKFADRVTLAEPSSQQLDIGKEFLKDHPEIDMVLTQADNLKFKTGELDLITMIRVMHHLPDPMVEFRELSRVLSSNGYIILEVANYAHGRNRLKHFLKGQRMPSKPVDIRSARNRQNNSIAFVNHNPKTVKQQLAQVGLIVEKTLSVSNLRSPTLKKIMPKNVMLSAERVMQPALAPTYFGPSVFFLIKKSNQNN